MADIIVHHLEKSRSHRVIWLLEELGLEYTLKVYTRDPLTIRADPALREIHPLGKAPVVTVDDDTFAESGAIIEALVEGLGEGRLKPPAGHPALARYRYWMHYAEGSLMPPLLVRLIFDRIKQAPLPFFIKPVARTIVSKVDAAYTVPELKLHFDFLEAHLGEHSWFAGEDFTAADIQMSYPIEAALDRVGGERPRMSAWVERIKSRPAYKAAEAKGGPNVMPD